MKVKVLCASGYNYMSKEGHQKQGMNLLVCSIEAVKESDGKGNFVCGHRSEQIYIPRNFILDANDLINLVGKDVELVYERKLGQKFEVLTDIRIL